MSFIVKDQLHRPLSITDTPKRIVSLVPSLTELVYDLGLGKAIVGITKFCVHPKHLKAEKTIVGGTKHVHIDKIKALQPDIILCNKEENTEAIVNACEVIASVHVSDIYTLADALELIHMYGEIFGVQEKAAALETQIQTKKHEFLEDIRLKPKLKVAYLIWRKPWMVAAKYTFINEVLQLNNFINVFEDFERYPEIELAEIGELQPDVVLLSSEPFPFKKEHVEELEAIFSKSKILLVDGEMFSWYGSRLVKAFDYFKKLHQSL